jgi:hypothetical protein
MSKSVVSVRRFFALVGLSMAALGLVGARSGGQTPQPGENPVIFVSGVTGVALREVAKGRFVWGKGGNLISPHDRGYATANPIVEDAGGPVLEPAGAILGLKLFGLLRFDVYQPLVDIFDANGYRIGHLESPQPEDEFFLFSYDWRQDNVVSAQRLARQLERLRSARGQDILRVTLVCQSNGAHVCRYFTKYGDLSLEEATAGVERKTSGVEVEKLVLVGASNGGSVRILREMTVGRKYVRGIGRFWSPETLFTYRSLFQDLPAYSSDLFVDELGAPMTVDLFSAATWQQYGWSIYSPDNQRQLSKKKHPAWFGDPHSRAEYLQENLDRARRFHRLLSEDTTELGATRYYLVTNTHIPTSARAALVLEDGHWQTLFAGDKGLRRRPNLEAKISVPGDGHATEESQLQLSPQEHARLARQPLDVDGGHRMVVVHPRVLQHLMEIVADGEGGGVEP